MALSQKLERFCREYVVDCNATQALIRAGYKPDYAGLSAVRIMKNPEVKALIDELQKKKSKRLDLNADWIVRKLRQVHRLSIEGIPIFDKAGCEIGRKIDTSGANKALELLGKHLAMFTEKSVVKVEGPVVVSAVRGLEERIAQITEPEFMK